MFASVNIFKRQRQSRRDDLISLVYILAYFLNGKLSWLKKIKRTDPDYLEKVGKIKEEIALTTICEKKAVCLFDFASEVFKLKFEEEPNYGKLKFMLTVALLQQNQLVDNHFEWSKWKQLKPQ
jgi:hypothetical protein